MDAKFFKKDAQEDIFDIRIDYNGTWYHKNTPIEREKLVQLFSTVLHYDPKTQDYWLITPHEQGRIEVEDSAYIIIDFEWDNENLTLTTNLEHQVKPSPNHSIFLKNKTPYCTIHNNVPARINRSR